MKKLRAKIRKDIFFFRKISDYEVIYLCGYDSKRYIWEIILKNRLKKEKNAKTLETEGTG